MSKYVITIYETIRPFSSQKEYCINPNNFNCGSDNEEYYFSYKVCSKQSTSSIKSLRLKTSNHKSVHTSFIKFNPSCKCLSTQPKGLIFAFTTIIIIIFLLLLLFLRLILLLLLSSLLILINISLSIVFDIS